MTKPPDYKRRTLLTEKRFYAFYSPPTEEQGDVVEKSGAEHVKDHVAVDNELWGDQRQDVR